MLRASSSISAAVLAIAVVGIQVPSAAQPDLLAPMRAAIGGDATINAVTSFSVSGSMERRTAPAANSTGYEVQCALPDRFVRTTRNTAEMTGLPRSVNIASTTTISSYGFNGAELISRTGGDATTAFGMPTVIRAPQSTDPAEVAEARRQKVSAAHREFLRFVLPRFGKSFPGAEITLEDAGTSTVDGRAVYQVKVIDWGNRVHVLSIDASTNLPLQLSWQDRPVVTKSLGTVMNVGVSNGASRDMPKFPADPTAGMPDVEHVLTFKRFKIENGLNWPREMSKTVDGKPSEDWTLGKVNLSPKFKADTFIPSK